MKQIRVCVIGGGASGLIASIFAAKEGAAVTLLEKNEKPAKKLLMTGNGRCNFTNEYQKLECYHSYHEKESQFIREVFEQFSMEEGLNALRSVLPVHTIPPPLHISSVVFRFALLQWDPCIAGTYTCHNE